MNSLECSMFIECKESQVKTLKLVFNEILKHIDDVVKEIDCESYFRY